MVSFTKALLAVAVLVGLASSAAIPDASRIALEDRSSLIQMTVINKCKHTFAPVFSPPLPGRKTWPSLAHGKSYTHSFRSDTYKGKVFSPLRKADLVTGEGATWGEFSLETGEYNISLEGGYNVPLFLWNQGRQFEGYCTPARCDGPSCRDAYRASSGLLSDDRDGDDTSTPNHSCPPSFGNWIVQFC